MATTSEQGRGQSLPHCLPGGVSLLFSTLYLHILLSFPLDFSHFLFLLTSLLSLSFDFSSLLCVTLCHTYTLQCLTSILSLCSPCPLRDASDVPIWNEELVLDARYRYNWWSMSLSYLCDGEGFATTSFLLSKFHLYLYFLVCMNTFSTFHFPWSLFILSLHFFPM